MPSELQPTMDNPKWEEERARFQVLEAIRTQAGADCESMVTGRDLTATLELPLEHLYRVITYLSEQGYLAYLGAGPRVCLTPAAVEYLEHQAGRRRSLRG